MAKIRAPSQLRPRITPKRTLDVLVVIDGTVEEEAFTRGKQLCRAIAARLDPESQLGVIQLGGASKVESVLSKDQNEIERRIEGITPLGGDPDICPAFEQCIAQFKLSRLHIICYTTDSYILRFYINAKRIYLFSNGNFGDVNAATICAKEIMQQDISIHAVGIGSQVNSENLAQVASPGSACMFQDFHIVLQNPSPRIQVEAQLTFPAEIPIKLGEEIFLKIKLKNIGTQEIPAGSRVFIPANEVSYFKHGERLIANCIAIGAEVTLDIKLESGTKPNGSNLDFFVQNLPELLELQVRDAQNEPFSNAGERRNVSQYISSSIK